jgi:hypothetical protein
VLTRAGKDLSRESLTQAAETINNWKDLVTVTWTATDRRGVTEGWIEQLKGETTVKITDIIKSD